MYPNNYSRQDDSKQLTEELVVWTVTTTYVWQAKRTVYKEIADYAKPIRSISKYVEDSSTGTSIKYRPNGIWNFAFAWNDRASLNYV